MSILSSLMSTAVPLSLAVHDNAGSFNSCDIEFMA